MGAQDDNPLDRVNKAEFLQLGVRKKIVDRLVYWCSFTPSGRSAGCVEEKVRPLWAELVMPKKD
jgi:hypothetical protein